MVLTTLYHFPNTTLPGFTTAAFRMGRDQIEVVSPGHVPLASIVRCMWTPSLHDIHLTTNNRLPDRLCDILILHTAQNNQDREVL